MNRRKLKTIVLGLIAGVLACTSFALVYADSLLLQIYQAQQENLALSAQATPMPVLQATPPRTTPTLAPVVTRAPLPGDIANVRFPNYDTGLGADYSYQTDELRIAVDKKQEDGVTYYVADIWMRNINCFRTAFSSGEYRGKRESPEKIARDNQAILAVNGDFLGGLVIRNGVLYRKANLRPTPTPEPIEAAVDYSLPVTEIVTIDGQTIIGASGQDAGAEAVQEAAAEPARPERSTCVLYFDGRMATEEYDRFSSDKAMEEGAWQGWQFGPTLVRNGQAAEDVKAQGRNPRCILGYYEPGHYCIILIDGRQKNYSIGMNYKEMIDLCVRMNLTEAYNLDGGGSAVMVFNGETINQPSGKGDGRNLPDMVVIGDYLAADQIFSPTPEPTPAPETTPSSEDSIN